MVFSRIWHFVNKPGTIKGFFPDINRIPVKYSLSGAIEDFITTGIFPTKSVWKVIGKKSIETYHTETVQNNMETDRSLVHFLKVELSWGVNNMSTISQNL